MTENSSERHRSNIWIWKGWGLNIPFSKADSCIHTKEGHPNKECYESVMDKHVFGLVENDVCKECSLYQRVDSAYWKKIKDSYLG